MAIGVGKVPDFSSGEYFIIVVGEETQAQHEPPRPFPLTAITLSNNRETARDLSACANGLLQYISTT